MPRYFFHMEGGPDDLGIELPSIAEAKQEAVRYVSGLLSDSAATFWDSAVMTVNVADDTGLILFSLTICGSDAPSILVVPKVST